MHAQPKQQTATDPAPLTDFNDLAASEGPDPVRKRIAEALAKAGAQQEKPDERKGPHYRLDKAGVWFHDVDKDGAPLPAHWICAPLEVIAKTRDTRSDDWGRLLQWSDADGVIHRWAAPMVLMIGDGRDFARELATRGLEIAPGSNAMRRLLAYVVTEPTKERARSVAVPGWHGVQYILPTGETFGTNAEAIAFQSAGGVAAHYGTAGDWRKHVAALCVGNSRLVLAVSAMFAGPLLRMGGVEGGGFHLASNSSDGKSTTMKVAASVVGPPEYRREWRVTANGLEGLATFHNDGTLILDEIAQIDAAQAGEAVYMLANGVGKTRASRTGEARPAATWAVQLLSSGEYGLAEHMAQAGKKSRAGQGVRLAEVPANAGAGLGVFETLHGAERGDTFADRLVRLSAEHYGGAWRPWLHYISTTAGNSLPTQLRREVDAFKADCVPEGADPQIFRVAARFGLCAAAGELATLSGLTGWPAGEARRAATKCFRSWLNLRGGVHNGEHLALMAQVRAFFESHGDKRLDPLFATSAPLATNRAGWKRRDPISGLQYIVTPSAFKAELCSGFDSKQAARWLIDAGWLLRGDRDHAAALVHIPALDDRPSARVRMYVFDATAVHGSEYPTYTNTDASA